MIEYPFANIPNYRNEYCQCDYCIKVRKDMQNPQAIAKCYIDGDYLLHLEWIDEKGNPMGKNGFVIDEQSTRRLLTILEKMVDIYDIYREHGIIK